jgi:thioredoxin reductase (NADPH)
MSAPLSVTDVAVIGAGPAGLFAVFQCGMLEMRCHVIDSLAEVGGQCTALYPEKPIYDIPGHPAIEAGALIDRLSEQAAPFKPVFHLGRQVTRLERTPDQHWRLTTDDGVAIEARAVIVAAGAGAFGPNRPPLAGIEDYEGRSVHYFVRRREEFTGKRVVIAGGGDSAVDWALALAGSAERVMVVHRRPKFRAAPDNANKLARLAGEGKVDLIVPYQLSGLEGTGGRLSAVRIATLDGEERVLEADHLLAFFGLSNDLGPIAGWGLSQDRNQIHVLPATCATNAPGIYAIGDIATYPGKLKLILTGFAEAAHAAHSIRKLVHPDNPHHFEHSTTKGVPAL